ncbi:MAG: aldo/keto reductase family oxidoreductase [Clostridiales bacterium]|nr:aldo/keto reductase family oxidoreductase [Clostridiales bacterium]
MKYCTLGGNHASRVVMGCMRIAGKPLRDIEKVIIEAQKSGVNMFDLADVYAGGDCERVFGVAMKDLGIARKDYILQTKCGIRRDSLVNGTRFDFSEEHIVASVDGSLKRLNTEYIDVFLLHRPDTLVQPEEVAAAFEKLRAAGKVRAFGVSNFSAGQMQLLEKHGVSIVANQMQFSLMHTPMIDAGFNVNMYEDVSVSRAGDALEYCRLQDIPMQAWSPLQYGFFEGVFVGNERFPELNAELKRLAEKYNCAPTSIAVAWILRHPAFKQVITGTTSPEHMREMCMAADIELTREEWYSLYLSPNRTLP